MVLNYNPDVLDALANLSSDEVFTPPKLVNQILDLLPQDIWSDSSITILDPCSKSWVFLREAAKRFIKGLEKEFPDLQERLDHIFTKQLFGIAITELTSLLSRRWLYCAKHADGKYSICSQFDNKSGNIRYARTEHNWKNGSCQYCGASEDEYSRSGELETHAYKFIHTDISDIPLLFWNNLAMKFDVIIGNPPYQLSTWWSWRQAKPIYHQFIEHAKKLNPRYLTMIIPARRYSWWMWLDVFRKEMLQDKRISNLVDFENSADVFPWVDIAWWVCYFLWQKDHHGKCKVTNTSKDTKVDTMRDLNEFDIFIRQERAISVIHKANKNASNWFLSDIISPIKPFGMPTNYMPQKSWTPCWFIQKYGLQFADPNNIVDRYSLLDKRKILVPKAPIAWQTDFSKPVKIYHSKNAFIAKPWECCTESYIVIWWFWSESEALFFRSYLFTKIVRFLILQTVISQDINKKNFWFVPHLWIYDREYTDEYLRNLRNISDDEWLYIDSRIVETE